ncbi:histidine kinase dimerization/phosphoacceptor domain -containing protein [Maribacter polysaccharolyticus]|uniref:tetratricopeptide repeat-containing sensor histidine kinase n=1 Tax=Maribacter polysaccharolyticus TaxID=3020831 RepID=UPI00237F6791|nr:histidine kinase dimerization/phosphoacceptor domain -containing protein [Maribacter polysaccharolyticus]MDE3740791.1 histidine kinase dimerization/phosphoacceptor domain -containing protein [Maribacter polysaccharolyticus]
MRTDLPLTVLPLTIFLFMGYFGISQIIDFEREDPYTKVFVATDNFGASYLDVLEGSYPLAQPDTLKFSMLNDLAYYWHTRNLKRSMQFTLEGLRLTSEAQNSLWEGRFRITQGAVLLRMEELDSALTVLSQAKENVIKSDLPMLYTQMGYVYERKGELDRAADFALIALEIGEELNDKKAIAMAYSDLSNLFWKQSKFKSGLEYSLKSVALFEERGINDLDYDFTLYLVGNNYMSLKAYKLALNYFNRAIAIGERYGFYNNLSDVYISKVDLYTYLNNFEKAVEAGENAVKYAELLDNDFMLMRSWLSIGKLQNIQGKYTSAIESLKKCIAIASDDFGDEYYLSQAYEALGKAYAGNFNYQEAYQAFAVYDNLKDKIFTAEADHRISQLRTEYDVAQKENTIQLQQTRITKQQILQSLIITIVILLVLYLILLYKSLKNNNKKNSMLQKQNEEKEFLLKEIHHRVKNNLEIVSSLLALQSAEINDEKIVEAMQNCRHRIQSMSMVHQKLYQEKSLSCIEMKSYFSNLSNYIINVFDSQKRIGIFLDMEEIELDLDTAIPIGLIVNELLTNSMKYAFPNGAKGTITIRLKKSGPVLSLMVGDNGIGFCKRGAIEGTGFGTKLVKLLTRQLDGKMQLKVEKGTMVSFEFEYNKAA